MGSGKGSAKRTNNMRAATAGLGASQPGNQSGIRLDKLKDVPDEVLQGLSDVMYDVKNRQNPLADAIGEEFKNRGDIEQTLSIYYSDGRAPSEVLGTEVDAMHTRMAMLKTATLILESGMNKAGRFRKEDCLPMVAAAASELETVGFVKEDGQEPLKVSKKFMMNGWLTAYKNLEDQGLVTGSSPWVDDLKDFAKKVEAGNLPEDELKDEIWAIAKNACDERHIDTGHNLLSEWGAWMPGSLGGNPTTNNLNKKQLQAKQAKDRAAKKKKEAAQAKAKEKAREARKEIEDGLNF